LRYKLYNTSGWSSLMISYMSRRTNNFSGDLLLFAIASPKLRSIATLLAVTSAKHWDFRESTPSNIWSQIFFSPEISNLIYSRKVRKNAKSKTSRKQIEFILQQSSCNESNSQSLPPKPPIAFFEHHPYSTFRHLTS